MNVSWKNSSHYVNSTCTIITTFYGSFIITIMVQYECITTYNRSTVHYLKCPGESSRPEYLITYLLQCWHYICNFIWICNTIKKNAQLSTGTRQRGEVFTQLLPKSFNLSISCAFLLPSLWLQREKRIDNILLNKPK